MLPRGCYVPVARPAARAKDGAAKATFRRDRGLYYVDNTDTRPPGTAADGAGRHVTALYEAHALSLARLALLMLGDQAEAQDVVQDAFLGLYRRWATLASADAAPGYLRASVLNGCRTALRRRSRPAAYAGVQEHLESAEALAIHTEEQRAVLAAVRRLPARQREALVLRYYLDMTEEQAARAMRVSRGTVKSATSRAVAAVGRMLKEGS
jgi:RNA polymerase sigma-70 factor (sigma-E family)